MNRRNFLKKLGIVCGAAVACPAELLKTKHPGIDKILYWPQEPGFYDVTHLIKGGRKIQRVVMFDEFATPRDMKYPWKYISIPFHYETTNQSTTVC